MEWNLEENFGMEWKKITSMKYEKIVFHSIPCTDAGCIQNVRNLRIGFCPFTSWKADAFYVRRKRLKMRIADTA